MKYLLLCAVCLLTYSNVTAQSDDPVALDPNQFVNTQILGDTLADGSRAHYIYTVEAGGFYAFDGRLDITFPVEIVGPDNGWIKDDATPPVLLNTPDQQGAARQFFEIQTGGSLVLRNVMVSGLVSTGETAGTLITNTGGSKYTSENVAWANWQDFLMRNQATNIDITITDNIFINGIRTRNSPWGGFPIRMDVAGENVTIENNTVVNSGRLLTNSGPFFNATIHELHNTYINSAKAGHEQRAYEMIQANNMYYNYDFLGHLATANDYNKHWTTWNYFSDASTKLDSVSLYLGQNLFYRQPALLDWFATQADTIRAGLLWEFASVDSFVVSDDDYRIGTNYAEFNPNFATAPSNGEALLEFTNDFYLAPNDDWVDWRIPNPVDFDANQQPMIMNWPPSFDLSYGEEYLKTAGSDGLPIGDLNWFPDAKASYLANRDAHIASLRDSVTSAVAVYVPGSPTPMLTPALVGVSNERGETPQGFVLNQNYPNPFNPTTNIAFDLPSAVNVKLTIYNNLGEEVAVLINNENRAPGSHNVQWDGRDTVGKLVASGLYVYKLETADYSRSKMMQLIK